MEPLSLLLAPVALAIVLSQTQAAIAAGVVVLLVIVLWKLAKLAFKIALVVGAAVALFFILRAAGVL